MIGAARHKKKTTDDIPTFRRVSCPSCSKQRLLKQTNEDGTVSLPSQETVEVRGEERFLEVCEFCTIKYQKQDETFARENLKKLAKAIKVDNLPDDEDGESDHRDFSLN